MASPRSQEQLKQETQYAFPYHHLVDYRDGKVSLIRQWVWGLNYLGRLDLVHQTLRDLPFESLIDIGCGDGKLIASLSPLFPTKLLHGVDYSQQAVRLAAAMCDAPNVKFLFQDITAPAAADIQYDVAVMIEVLEHIPSEEASSFLLAVRRRLRRGGHIICTTPSTRLHLPKKHFQHFSSEHLAALFRAADFDIVAVDQIDGLPFYFRVVRKIFINRLYCVTSQRAENTLFRIYKAFCLRNQGAAGQGLFLIGRAR